MKRKMIASFILTVLFLASVFSMTIHSGAVGSHSGSGLLGAQSTPDPVDEWPMFHHDAAHTGYSTSPAPTTNQTLWNYTTGSYVGYSSPAVVDGVVYVGSNDDNVYALNAATGEQIWNYTATGFDVVSCPAVAGGIVYVGSYPVVAFNATTGALIWSYFAGGVSSSPAVVDGVVYVGSNDDNVYALNATTGTQIWNYYTGDYVYSSPAVVSGVVYVGSGPNVFALNATTRVLIWSKNISNAHMDSSPAVADGKVYVGSEDSSVYALNATTGVLIWNFTTGASVYSSPAVAGGVVYIGSNDDKVYAFGVHDVAVTNVASSKTVVGQGFSASINVTVANQGGYTEVFNVTAYANVTAIQTETLTLSSQDSATLTFTWNTTGFTYGNYTISAYAWPMPGETNTANNNFTDGAVTVTIPGDINADFKVSLADLVFLSNAYGTTPASGGIPGAPHAWNPNADINGDGKVSLSDLVILSNHYGQHYP